jgi:hypothetical protein
MLVARRATGYTVRRPMGALGELRPSRRGMGDAVCGPCPSGLYADSTNCACVQNCAGLPASQWADCVDFNAAAQNAAVGVQPTFVQCDPTVASMTAVYPGAPNPCPNAGGAIMPASQGSPIVASNPAPTTVAPSSNPPGSSAAPALAPPTNDFTGVDTTSVFGYPVPTSVLTQQVSVFGQTWAVWELGLGAIAAVGLLAFFGGRR